MFWGLGLYLWDKGVLSFFSRLTVSNFESRSMVQPKTGAEDQIPAQYPVEELSLS